MSMDAQNRLYLTANGYDVVLCTYTSGTVADDYEDVTITGTDSTISVLRKVYKGGFTADSGGAIPTGDAVYWVKDTVTLYDGGTSQASQITDDGVSYQVNAIDNQRNGILAVLVERKRPA